MPWWYVLFFVSGLPALIYQTVWQHALFTLFGVNIEAVTMVVTAFMLGLGLGSLLGGHLTRSQRLPLLALFGVAELLIALYGFFSLRIFKGAAELTAGGGALQTGLVAFGLVVAPTMLMGATLPILVAHTVRRSRNVGASVGALYAANTFGSAAACFCVGLVLMRWLGQTKAVALAATLNVVVGTTVLLLYLATRTPPAAAAPAPTKDAERATPPAAAGEAGGPAFALSFPLALVAAAVAGFISLGYEIVWYRLFSFTTGGLAKSFAFLLGAYLAGLAVGSLVANRVCTHFVSARSFFRFLVVAVLGANLVGFLVGPILLELAVQASYLWTLVPIGVAAACLGAVFPMLCHVSMAPDQRAGARMSYVYLANIVGSATGSYLTGFVLMDVLPLYQITTGLALAGVALGLALTLKARWGRAGSSLAVGGGLAIALLVLVGGKPLHAAMYEKLLLKLDYSPVAKFAASVESRSGVVTLTPAGVMFGGGAYDGRVNTSLVDDVSMIQRLYALSYYHPQPKEMLTIGLATGSWAQVLANHPQVEHLTIVEINPGYLEIIRHLDPIASLFANPKVRLEIDDGRRWLVHNRDAKFDAIVMNTTLHWRANASNLLSREFLELVRRHLAPGGVYFYNATYSPEAMATAVRVFPYAIAIGSFIAVSDSPLQLDRQRWSDVLARYTIDGKPLFDLTKERDRRRFAEVLHMTETMDQAVDGMLSLESAEHMRQRTRSVRTITDDNMGPEWGPHEVGETLSWAWPVEIRRHWYEAPPPAPAVFSP